MASLPSGGMKTKNPPPAPFVIKTGQVESIYPNGKLCKVNKNGSIVTVVVPGNIRGLKVGDTVAVRIQGNDRIISELISHREVQKYQPAGSTNRSVPSGSVYKPASGTINKITNSGLDRLYWSPPYLDPYDLPYPLPASSEPWRGYVDSNRDRINELYNWARAASQMIMNLCAQHDRTMDFLSDLNANMNLLIDQANGTKDNFPILEQLRDNVGTLLNDLSEQGLTQ